VTPTRNTPTWQFSCLPTRPQYCRFTPTLCVPFFTNPDSSSTPTVPIDQSAVEGINFSAKTAWISPCMAWVSHGE